MNTDNPFDLTGKTALVTGGNQGLGEAFAVGLARAGARVAISGRRAEANATAAAAAAQDGIELVPLTADITDDAQVAAMTEQARDALGGRIDILVNNAGTCYHAPSFEVTDAQWADVFDLNVRALWKTSLAVGALDARAGLRLDRQHRQHVGPDREPPAVAAGVQRLEGRRAPPHQVAGRGVGAVRDPRQRRRAGLRQDGDGPGGRPKFHRHWIEDTPQQRAALPEEIAPSVVFLASDAASFITGSVLVADGGYSAV